MEEIIQGFVKETLIGLEQIHQLCCQAKGSLSKGESEKVFFVMHSLTGSAPMFGFGLVASYSLYAERVYDQIRKGNMITSPEIIEKTIELILVIQSIVLKESGISERNDLIDFFKSQIRQ